MGAVWAVERRGKEEVGRWECREAVEDDERCWWIVLYDCVYVYGLHITM
jgi:hypothetical protein